MKQFILLPEMYDGLKARRLSKFGRVELLRVIEEPPWWFVRIRNFKEKPDRDRMRKCGSEFGNGYWRFGYLDDAQAKFKELAAQPESLNEEHLRVNLREKQKQRFKQLLRSGKLQSFKPKASK